MLIIYMLTAEVGQHVLLVPFRRGGRLAGTVMFLHSLLISFYFPSSAVAMFLLCLPILPVATTVGILLNGSGGLHKT